MAKEGAAAKEAGKEAAAAPRRRCQCCRWYCTYVYIPVVLAILGHIGLSSLNDAMQHDGWGGVPRTLQEETEMCPQWVVKFLNWKVSLQIRMYQDVSSAAYDPKDVAFHPSWAGDYMVSFYSLGLALMASYGPRHADSVKLPVMSGSPPGFRVGSTVAPDRDIDDPMYFPLERLVPRFLWSTFFPTLFNCFQGILRDFPFDDMLSQPNETNTWRTLVQPGRRKRDFVMSFYEGRHLFDGKTPMYPTPMNDFASLFLKADAWDDGLEKAMAFDLIGAHRVEQAAKEFRGETLPFKLALNEFAALKVRKHFARYGADMYFTAEGLPALIVTPDGREVQRGDRDWQYWKFVWRSTLCSAITLIDHLHLTHYRAANIMSSASRSALPPKHPMRRLQSIFTFGSIFINNVAQHLLVAERSPLHRATPFEGFESLGPAISKGMKPLVEWHKPLLDDAEWERLPELLKKAPYFADGRLLMGALKKMGGSLTAVLFSQLNCTQENNFTLQDVDVVRFMRDITKREAEAGYKLDFEGVSDCRSMHEIWMGYMWTLTGWHRHVGVVADYFADPDLAGFSWREGERSTAPKQAMLMSVVAAVTGTPHPKIKEDFSHLFADLPRGEEITKVLDQFRKDLGEVDAEVKRRNEKRRVKNYQADPSLVECSVAV